MKSKLSISVHAGSLGDSKFKGITNPIYTSAAYDYLDVKEVRYPRYFNTPNQQAVAAKVAALEQTEDALIFSSGMAAIMTALMAFLKTGDHAILQSDLYGGTYHALINELPRYGIEFDFADGQNIESFQSLIKSNTRVIYIETPSNPLLKITDIAGVAKIAKAHNIITLIDNTFASPINQNPYTLGIDIVLHSATKYLGGHSDLSAGVAAASTTHIKQIWESAIHFGGHLEALSCYLLERSIKTLAIRVKQQNVNAMEVARFLASHHGIKAVYYPGLEDHPNHEVAKAQMPGGFGGMLSFEPVIDAKVFASKLKLIKTAISLGGVESTISSPMLTSHAKMSAADRAKAGIADNLLRFSVGIEEPQDLIDDLTQAMN
ncbi:MAG TPA: PLP-dependent aspartate aminotransferase family protein [Cyclobacteriaceae bacterium]|nr:PLP-dependent aspartate aminotransferase family protein [Cyclobacteriaceae bacterium]